MPEEVVTPPTEPVTPPQTPPEAPKDDALKALEAKHAETLAKLEAFEAERAATKKAEEDAKKTLEERLAERETAVKALERQSLINKVRFDGGFTAAVFSGFAPAGDTEAEIKASYEGFKATVDEYAKTPAPKAGVGGGTGSADVNKKVFSNVISSIKDRAVRTNKA
jgi:hypothetical protein